MDPSRHRALQEIDKVLHKAKVREAAGEDKADKLLLAILQELEKRNGRQ